MRVRVAQCLCPSRHAILAFALNDADTTDDETYTMLVQVVQAALDGKGAAWGLPIEKMNPWCGLCGATSTAWIYEVKWSKEFADWNQAQQVLKEFETRQMLTHAVMDMLGVSYDSRRKTGMN
jgi:hypothetical protein